MKRLTENEKGLAPLAVALVVAGLIVIGGGGWYLFVRDDGEPTTSETTAETSTEVSMKSDDSSFEGTYFDAIGRGNPLECDWRLPEELASEFQVGQGKFYTDGVSRGYSTGTFENQGATVTANSIFNNEGVSYWTELPGGANIGFKITKAVLEAQGASQTEAEKQQGREFRANYSFTCQPWTVEEEKLTVPADITFRDISDIPTGGDGL